MLFECIKESAMKFQTRLLHGKSVQSYEAGATVPAISQCNAYSYESSEQLEKVFQNRAPGFAYSRIANPTVDAFERRVNELEGGIGGELEIRISTLEITNPDKIFAEDIQRIVRETLEKLPEQTRVIFEMNRFQNLSKKEIAEKLGISIKGIDYHISKALKCLRENLQDYFPIIFFLFF